MEDGRRKSEDEGIRIGSKNRGPTGKKKQTFVYAAGTKLATQSEYTYQSTTTEAVSFEHFDASAMSYRSSLSSGSPIVGDGSYDGAPAEMDPMGGNMGTVTPYVEELVEPPDCPKVHY